MKKKILYGLLGVLGVFVLIQLIPVDRTNPPVTAEIKAPPKIMAILKTSCYDCHSNQTKWPFYSYIAPISWFVAHDVHEGREKLNFSEWGKYTKKKQRKRLQDALEEVEAGDMPIGIYLLAHPKAEVSPQQVKLIKQWVNQSLAKMGVKKGHRHKKHKHPKHDD
ncbi:MAG: heme-binding protein [Gammaproteobacteria bacterium]|nr:MAG: heme-binding protein [Gammaproteobacteria bacterium]